MESWNSYFDTPSGNRLGIISAASYLPSLVLLPVISLMCDYLGRRPTALVGCAAVVVGALVGAFAKNEGMLIAGRAIVGPAGSFVALATTGSQGNGVAVISYYLTPVLRLAGITQPVRQTGLNLGLQVFNLLMAGGGAALVERVGRRPLWMFSTGAMLVCFAGLLGTSAGFAQTGKTSIGFASVAFIFLSCEFGTFL